MMDKITKLNAELDQKSRVIQTYVLRDNLSALQPDVKPPPAKVNSSKLVVNCIVIFLCVFEFF